MMYNNVILLVILNEYQQCHNKYVKLKLSFLSMTIEVEAFADTGGGRLAGYNT